MILIFLFVFAMVITLIYNPSILGILSNNRNKRKITGSYRDKILEQSENNTMFEELDFPLATIASSKNIKEVRDIIAHEAEHISPFLVIESLSECYNNCFLIAGNFTGTRLLAQQREVAVRIWETSMERLYEGNVVVQQNESQTFTLRSVFPENKNHDFYIRDFIGRLKALIS